MTDMIEVFTQSSIRITDGDRIIYLDPSIKVEMGGEIVGQEKGYYHWGRYGRALCRLLSANEWI